MAFRINYSRIFEKTLTRLDRQNVRRVLKKSEDLSTSLQGVVKVLHCPPDLPDLQKIRVGDWRVFLWIDEMRQEITLYAVWHRCEAYKKLFNK